MRTTYRRRALRAALGMAFGAALVAPAAIGQAPGAKMDNNPGRMLYATDSKGNLLSFSAALPKVVQSTKKITGLPTGVSLRAIDFRPATGDLYGVGGDSVVYRVNPSTAIAVAEGPAFRPVLRGRYFGLDFNPTVDLIRLTSDFEQNQRLHPDAGNVVARDADLNPEEPTVVGSAYTSSGFSAARPASTTLYALDAGDDVVYRQNPPNAGTLVEPKDLPFNVRGDAGFDIAGTSNVGYVATAPDPSRGAELFRIDPATGTASSLGLIGGGGVIVTGLAAVQDAP